MLSPHITIWDVLPTLAKPSAYIDAVLNRMDECVLAHGEAYVRLGVKGNGSYPSFRVIYYADGHEKIHGSYIDSGTPFPEGFDNVIPGDWSTVVTPRHEVIEAKAKVSLV
jgi:hypothetical protein